MRSFARLLLVAAGGVLLGSPLVAQKADDQLDPKSVALMQQGRSLLASGKFEQAENALETALAVDPRNRWAYIEIARVADRQRLYGKAIRMTNKALAMEPNDPDAIAVQGEAMVELGAIARAQENLRKLQSLCAARACPQVAQLSGAISRGPTVASAKIPDTPKSN